MRTNTKTTTLAMFISLAAAGAAHADMDIMNGKATVSGEVDVEVQQRLIDGSQQKFEEYRDVREGVGINDFRLKVQGNTTPYHLDIKVKDVAEDDEFYSVKGGRHGKYGFSLFYDSIPHNFSTGTLIFAGAGTSYLRVPDRLQADLEANDLLRVGRGGDPLTPQPQDAAQQAIVRDAAVNTNLHVFKLKREKTGFGMDYNITDDVKAWAKVTNEKRSGTRIVSVGTYERYPQTVGGVHVSDLFLVSGTDLAEPIDYRTTTMNVGAGVYKKQWLADIQYTFTNFENENSSLRWDNPFRITDLSSSNAAGATNTANGDYNRGRFAMGQLSLPQDSQSHDVTASASVELPLHSRFTGTLSFGLVTQDQDFLPYTLNSAVSGTNVPAFAGPAAITSPLTVVQTSGHANQGGEVRTWSQSYQLSSKPIEPLTVTAKYRYYDYDNESSYIQFPGYAAFGESFWRTGGNDPRAAINAGTSSRPLSYTRQNAELGIEYRLLKPLTVSVEGGWEGWDRENLRIRSTDELSAGGGFVYKPTRRASLSGRYKYAHRTVDGYEVGGTIENPEAIGQLNYDWAERKRHQADLRFTMSPVEPLTFGVSGQYRNDDFGGSNRFGLKNREDVAGALDLSYTASDRLTVFANYVKSYSNEEMQSAAKDNAVAGENYFPRNYWNSDVRENVDTAGAGLTLQVIPKKLSLNTTYNISLSRMKVDTSNPYPAANTLQNAVAQPWPTIRNRYQEVRTDIGYNFTENLKAGVRYVYEWYDLDYFANTPAYMAGYSVENSTKLLSAGATSFSYEAHVAGAYLNYRF